MASVSFHDISYYASHLISEYVINSLLVTMEPTSQLTQLAIFWDIENVHDIPSTHEQITNHIRESGRVVKAYAFADWDTRRIIAENLHELGYDLIHVPSPKDNASDYKMASYMMEHVVRYPETDEFVMISGDGDFKLIAGALRDRGLGLWIISNPIITSTELIDLATKYSDIYSFRPSALECAEPEDCLSDPGRLADLRRIAGVKLQEAIRAIEDADNTPGIGHVKHVISALNPNFDEKILGFQSWTDFLSYAEDEGYIEQKGQLPGTILTIPADASPESDRISEESRTSFKVLCEIVEEQMGSGERPTLDSILPRLRERDIDLPSLGYPSLADFVLAAEKRGFVRVVPSEEEGEPHIIPNITSDRVRTWFEENVKSLFGPSVKIPKDQFLEKIAEMLIQYKTSLRRLESYLRDEEVKESYQEILERSNLPFLPPYQMSLAHVLLGKDVECDEVIQRVNDELTPLGITLFCEAGS